MTADLVLIERPRLQASGGWATRSVLAKAIADRWRGIAVGMIANGLFLALALAAYKTIDLAVYTSLPEAMRSIMGIAADADVASLAYGVMFGMMCAMTLAGLAISIGAATVAGEERDGTLGLLLGNPRGRRRLLQEKSAALVVLMAFGGLLLLVAGLVAPRLVSTDIGGTDVVAITVHLVANALFFGFLAVAIGAVTGNRKAASAGSAGLMVLSYFLVGLLPLVSSLAGLAKVVPWYWFDGHDPLLHGVNTGWLALQMGFVVAFAATAWWGVQGRDLKMPMSATTLLDRLRGNPRTRRIFDRLAGSARVSRVGVKTAAESQAVLVVTASVMFGMMGILMGPMYAAIEDTLQSMADSFPPALLAFVGGGDMTTPEGWYQVETFGLMAPIAVILVAATVGIRALAGEEARGTMGLLLANPISRRRVVLEKAVAMMVHAGIVGIATFAGVAGGSLLSGLGMSLGAIAATCVLVTLLGILFGALGLALGAATGDVRVATMGTIGVASTAYLANSFLAIADGLDGWAILSPFHWYLGGNPLVNGMDWSAAALFVGFTVALIAAAVKLFDARDLRHH